MDGSYEFLTDLTRLKGAFKRFQSLIWALNTAIISIAIYAIFLLIGIPTFTKFYWQDFLPLAELPVIISIFLGALGATLIRRRSRSDFFSLLGPELSEKAKAAYDNRSSVTLPMQNLSREVKISLAGIKASKILNWRQANLRIVFMVALFVTTVLIAHSQISADITPNDFQSITDLRDRVLGAFQNQTHPQNQQVNLSGNIYGKPSLAVLNENKLQLQLYPGIGAGSVASPAEQNQHLFQQSQPTQAAAVPSDLYIESLPPQNKEIIKKYFQNLAGS